MEYSFDKKRLYDLIYSFYLVTKIKVVIKDNNLQDIVSVPENNCGFCTAIRKNRLAVEKCYKCETENCNLCKKSGELNIYKCHAGLTEVSLPIKIDNVNVGYIMFGQILEENEKAEKRDVFLKYAAEYTDEGMNKYYDELTQKSTEEIKAAAQILEACAGYLIRKELVRIDSGSIAFKISNFINDNLSDDISVDTLCNHFGLSRNMLYKITNEYFGMPIAKYIRKKRVERAVKLIQSGISIADAAGFTGFGDYSYFTKVVKSETGRLPSQLKNK